jgi:nitroimidazol reductase NimA-like FMN-containing flavoprotein (pyridoxamine 5'-phosphate oxidase superfamily)
MLKIRNASPGFGAPFNEEEIREFLTTKVLMLHLGTVDEKGHSNIHPVAYYYNPSKNRFYILTEKESKKVHNLRQNELIYFCVDDPSPPYKGVRGKGTVVICEDLEFNISIMEKVIPKYSGKLEDPTSQALLEQLKKGEAVVLEITPAYYSAWDFSKQ